jgi:hypothetical protein
MLTIMQRSSHGRNPALCPSPVRNSIELRHRTVAARLRVRLTVLVLAVSIAGCGKTMQHAATEQLVLSDAVDRSVASIDFTPLSGAKCFLDSSNLKSVKLTNVVNSSYVISSIRNQLMAAGCLLVEDRGEAQVVIEPRLGTLGADAHEVTYGIPSSSMLSQAASLVPTSPPIPTIPEISLAKKDDQTGAAKVAVFAYDAESGRPIWQSGTTTAKSTSRNLWIFGVGPFQSGSVHEGPKFAGAEMSLPQAEQKRKARDSRQVISLGDAFLFGDLPKPDAESEIQQASAEEQAE